MRVQYFIDGCTAKTYFLMLSTMYVHTHVLTYTQVLACNYVCRDDYNGQPLISATYICKHPKTKDGQCT